MGKCGVFGDYIVGKMSGCLINNYYLKPLLLNRNYLIKHLRYSFNLMDVEPFKSES